MRRHRPQGLLMSQRQHHGPVPVNHREVLLAVEYAQIPCASLMRRLSVHLTHLPYVRIVSPSVIFCRA